MDIRKEDPVEYMILMKMMFVNGAVKIKKIYILEDVII
tara:strand:- start:75 stop:188 length:114 start_codon:yes stop_codon:yes gene_type:complete